MKKFNKYCIALVLMLISLCMVFTGCNNNPPAQQSKKLATPYLPYLIEQRTKNESDDKQAQLVLIDEETGGKRLVTDRNVYASKYLFAIYENSLTAQEVASSSADTKSRFTSFTTTNNYLDVSDIFTQAKTYYFYYQVLGDGVNYLDSDTTKIFSYKLLANLDAPTISADGYRVSWNRVPNAIQYRIYINGSAKVTTQELSYDLENLVAGKYATATITVKALGDAEHADSVFSNDQTISGVVNLPAPVITSVTQNIITWNTVQNSSSYTISYVDLNVVKEIATVNYPQTSFSLTSFFADSSHDVGTYYFRIKCNGSEFFYPSDYSPAYEFKYEKPLEAPVIDELRSYQEEDNIYIYWNEVPNAVSYSIYINNKLVENNCVNNALTISVSYLQSAFVGEDSYLFKVKANAIGYYLESDFSNSIGFGTLKLDAPSIRFDSDVDTKLIWDTVNYAQTYKVHINEKQFITTATIFNFADYVTEPGEYTIYVVSSSTKRYDSVASNILTYTKKLTIITPTITRVDSSSNGFEVYFAEVSNATKYSLKVNGVVVDDNIQSSPYTLDCNEESSFFASDYNYIFEIKAVGSEFYEDSAYSKQTSVHFQFSTPLNLEHIRQNKYVTWASVSGATQYGVKFDNRDEVIVNENKIYYSTILDENKAYQVVVRAIGTDVVQSSEYSSKIFVNTTTQDDSVVSSLSKYFNSYFYYDGQYYDYYVESQEELNYAFIYSSIFNSPMEVYQGYDDGITQQERLDLTAKNIYYLGTVKGYYDIRYSSTNVIHLEYVSEIPDIKSISTDFAVSGNHELLQTYVEDVRGQDYEILTDKYFVEIPVTNSDQIFWAVKFEAKPIFNSSATELKEIYLRAKIALNSILSVNDTDYQKAVKIADYVMANTQYDDKYSSLSSDNSLIGRFHFLEGFFIDGKVVCDGYAKTFGLLCNMEGIETIMVSGYLGAGGHAWNKIKLDVDGSGIKNWYTVDLTDCDSSSYTINGKTLFTHSYFLLADSQTQNRTENPNLAYPKSETPFNYYQQSANMLGRSLYANTRAELRNLLLDFKNSDLTFIDLAWNLELNNILNSILVELGMNNAVSSVYIETGRYLYGFVVYSR